MGWATCKMREAGQDGVGLALGQIQQRLLETQDGGADGVDLVAQPEPHVGGDLIIARASGVQLLAGIADVRGEGRLHVHVDILQRNRPDELAGIDARAHRLQPADDGVALGRGQDTLTGQHGGMGDRTLNVVPIQTPIEVDGGGESLHEGIGRRVEAAGPGLGGRS